MQTRLEVTGDGSHTLFVPELNEHYHSTFGAIQESLHIFIQSGFLSVSNSLNHISILEVGFGTGLNALLTFLQNQLSQRHLRYTAIEKYPLVDSLTQQLNYPAMLKPPAGELFQGIHQAGWDVDTLLSPTFILRKQQADIITIPFGAETYDLIYFDAFGPDVQPELWSGEIFQKIIRSMNPGGIFVTYSAKGSVRRALQNAGFTLEKLPGPPGKREITRARVIG
jgi:tRNA U34 5-methylaminomethyl-2-thiouridine-forming methyltransferase MnmC